MTGQDNKTTILIIIGGLVLLVVAVWLILSCWKWTNRHRGFAKQGSTQFRYQDLAAATNNFCEELGKGSFGVVYKGYLKTLERDVAVKEILNTSNNSDFYAELKAITSVTPHKNLVKLVGWCRGSSCNFVEFMCWWCRKNQSDKLFLVYELEPKGNLHDNLHKKEEPLPWETRYKIVKDITYALHYLHLECRPFILHRDIKPGNILLDDNLNAKLADFGLSRIGYPDSSKILTIAVGTEAYIDPQCKKSVGKVEYSRSSDVYSFGIVLLEIACGEQGGTGMREKIWKKYIKKTLLQAADVRLKGEFIESEMETVLKLGLWCSYLDKNKRPTMKEVMDVLERGPQLLPDDLNSLVTPQQLPDDLNSLDTTSVLAIE